MSSNLHTFDSVMRPVTILILLVAIGSGAALLWRANNIQLLARTQEVISGPADWPEVGVPASDSLSVFVYEGPVSTRSKTVSDGLDRYRFAGTFFGFGEEGKGTAVIDDIKVGREFLVNEGDQVGDLTINRIFIDKNG